MDEVVREAIVLYLIHNMQALRRYVSPLTRQRDELLMREENKLFNDEINSEWSVLAKTEIGIQLQKALGVDAISTMSVLEDLDLKAYFGEKGEAQ